jgi:uncharacterized membrane protein YqjE
VWGGLVEGFEHRFDLFAIELKESNERHARLLLSLQVGALALFMAFLSLNALLIVAFWENRVLVVAGISIFYAAAGVALLWRTLAKIRLAAPPFEATVGELRKDYESWRVQQ